MLTILPRSHGPRHQKRRREVRRDHVVPLRQRHLQRRNAFDDARIVDQNADGPHLVFYPRDRLGHLPFVRHVEQVTFRFNTLVPVNFQRLFESVGRMPVNHQRRPRLGQRRGHGHAETVRSARHQGHFAFERKKIEYTHRFQFSLFYTIAHHRPCRHGPSRLPRRNGKGIRSEDASDPPSGCGRTGRTHFRNDGAEYRLISNRSQRRCPYPRSRDFRRPCPR